MDIKEKVDKLIHMYRTNEPFEIADRKNIPIIIEPLGDIWGYCHSYKRIQVIHLNSDLDYIDQRFSLAHELAHVILHPKINTGFLRMHTFFSAERIEREANSFAVELLMPDSVLYTCELRSIFEIATVCGVPEELAELKKSSAKFFYPNSEHAFLY
ncbi:putative Zn peptidase [Desulfitobacterium dehalogenans ATCC 51507]|uniref:Putative Zn peptidase n=1 Tax=Desulfitobacterium dehalogenans (strain ATCC 51507 / DSM 9161 / JW/IU-DC1) TaxID=756499 RepID=I4A688_DESDJ|nr:ImmA/IrrE family metallo-endopeptidase [Desulfitobacterium dehalogenans]AFL99472.1 putative Zn peptidase [Desulfitobacterium dehalogenans ATCC 51507]